MVLVGALLGTAAPVLAAQVFEGMLTTRVRGMPDGTMMKSYFKGSKTRMEIVAAGRPPIVALLDSRAGEQFVLLPGQPIYIAMKLSGAGPATPRKNEGVLVKTVKRDRVAGYRCSVYRYRGRDGVLDLCLAGGLGVLKAGSGFWGGRSVTDVGELPGWARVLGQTGGFPLRVADTTGAVVWEVTAVRRKRLDPTLFTIPSDYRRMQVPSVDIRLPTGP
jgi:hypothetical protein